MASDPETTTISLQKYDVLMQHPDFLDNIQVVFDLHVIYDVLMQHPDFWNNIQIIFDLHVITKVRCA